MKNILILTFIILLAINTYSQPNKISYQGVLTDNSGDLINGNRDLIFRVYNALTNGTLLATDTHSGVSIENGLFSVELNIGSVNFAENLWLEIQVEATTLSPRIAFNATGYAIKSSTFNYFDVNRSTSEPNTSIPAHQIIAFGNETDIDIAINPKGNGAILADIPDGLSSGGNKRGTYAVDLQSVRTNANQVASGINSVIAGGLSNLASNGWSTVSGGNTNTASGQYSNIGGGLTNTASGENSTIGGGIANTSSMYGSTVGGGVNNSATNYGSTISGGSSNIASGNYSTVVGGRGNTAQSYCETVLGLFATVGAGDIDSYVATDRLLVVGNGTADGSRSNAMTVLKNGNSMIGGSLTINENGINSSYSFPTTRGSSGQVLQTDGIGNTSWQVPNLIVKFNDSFSVSVVESEYTTLETVPIESTGKYLITVFCNYATNLNTVLTRVRQGATILAGSTSTTQNNGPIYVSICQVIVLTSTADIIVDGIHSTYDESYLCTGNVVLTRISD